MSPMIRQAAVPLVAALSLVAAACGGGSQQAAPPSASAPAAAQAAPPPAQAAEAPPPTAEAMANPTDGAPPPTAEGTVAAAEAVPTVDEAALTAILATADAVDGKTDMVVSKCPGCKLGMDGKAEHAVQAHGYALHFCSAECKDMNAPNLDATIAALK